MLNSFDKRYYLTTENRKFIRNNKLKFKIKSFLYTIRNYFNGK